VYLNAVANLGLRTVRVTPKDEVTSAFTREEAAGLLGRVPPPDRAGRPSADTPLPTVEADQPLRIALRQMQVLHPDGRPTGVLMLEDTLEELVGEIRDATQRRD
jgi:hypothetical protein